MAPPTSLHPRHVVFHECRHATGPIEQRFEIDARVKAHGVEHVHKVFGADIAARPRREWAFDDRIVHAEITHA
jgi:hypothetical protein